MGYKVTDALLGGDRRRTIEDTGGVHQASDVGRRVVWQMNTSMAKQLLRSLRS